MNSSLLNLIFYFLIEGVHILGDIRSEIKFYGDAQADQYNVISERISDDTPPDNDNFDYGHPHSNALL